MYLDDLPVWSMVGELLPNDPEAAELIWKSKNTNNGLDKDDLARLDHLQDVSELGDLVPYIYTERTLRIKYNKDQIVQVDLTNEPSSLVKMESNKPYEFILNTKFENSTTDETANFHSRFDRYLDHEFFKHPIHWFSVFNSFMMVLFLMGLVALILLRTLKKDYARYGIINDLEDGGNAKEMDSLLLDDGTSGGNNDKHTEDAGWKQVHGDVFHAPIFLTFFAACNCLISPNAAS